MKQLDGLKSVADVRVPIRKFLKDGLESMGPAGEGVRGGPPFIRPSGHRPVSPC